MARSQCIILAENYEVMEISKLSWQPFDLAFDKEIHNALLQQHHAAQFIAMAGRYLVPREADDSNTNMEFLPESGSLAGHELPGGLHLSLQLSDLSFCLTNRSAECISKISIPKNSKREVYDELKKILSEQNVDVSHFKNELHYEMPAHKLDSGAKFSIANLQAFEENVKGRYNAEIVLNEIVATFEGAEPLRIWPHHFDTGTILVLSKNDQGEAIQTIGIGWAIPDSMVSEPYFYLSFWSQEPKRKSGNIPALVAGKWMMPDWDGGVLRHSEILNAGSGTEQYKLVKSFYRSGIHILMDQLI